MGLAEDLSAWDLPTAPTGQAGAQAGMARLAREIIASYEARVSSVEQIIEATHEMLEAFRSQREAMRTQLRETLARAASLRRRDFDVMMQGILARQEEREQAVKETMRGYLKEQRELAAALKETLPPSQAERTSASSVEPIGSVQEVLKGIEARWQEREREVRGLLAEFQREQEELTRTLGGFLSNGGSLKVKAFKAALTAIQPRREEGRKDGGAEMRVLRGEGFRSL